MDHGNFDSRAAKAIPPEKVARPILWFDSIGKANGGM